MYAPSFTRVAIRDAESRISQCLVKFLEKLSVYAETSHPVDLTRAFMCLAADTTMNFTFQKPYGALDAEEFKSELIDPIVDFSRMQQWPFYFPNAVGGVFRLTKFLPTWVIERWFKGISTQQEGLKVRGFCPTRLSPICEPE